MIEVKIEIVERKRNYYRAGATLRRGKTPWKFESKVLAPLGNG